MSQSSDRKSILSWCLFDWASSPYPTVIITFVFSAFFTKAVAETPEIGASQWGVITGLAGFMVALLAPITGGIADHTGRAKFWLGTFTALVVLGSFFLWFTMPYGQDNGLGLDSLTIAAIGVILSMVGFETGMVFYNVLLAHVAPQDKVGRISGYGWGLGYFGALVALVGILFGFVQVEVAPFGLDKEAAEHIRIVPVVVGLWFLVFAIPLFLFVREDRKAPSMPLLPAIGRGVKDLIRTLKHVRSLPDLFWFLLARMMYMDGLNALFALGGVYAAAVFDMTLAEIIQFGIALNVVGGIGCFVMGWLDDRLGPLFVVRVSLLAVILVAIPMVITDQETLFWGLAMILGFCMGPIQSASRSYMTRMAPEEQRAEFFGLYAFSGRITSFIGPFLFAIIVDQTGSHRWGMSVCILMVVIGLILTAKMRAMKTAA